jgi:hypothetical protein
VNFHATASETVGCLQEPFDHYWEKAK